MSKLPGCRVCFAQKLTPGKTVDAMTNEERRYAECFFAEMAVKHVLKEWGNGWALLSSETRKAYLLKVIVEYMSGQSWYTDAGLPRQRGVGWTTEDC